MKNTQTILQRAFFIGLFFLASLNSVAVFAQSQSFIVRFESEKSFKTFTKKQQAYKNESSNSFKRINLFKDSPVAYVESQKSYEWWLKQPGVSYVQKEYTLKPRNTTPNDPFFPQQWHLLQTHVDELWESTLGDTTSSGWDIVIGTIESNGFQIDHPELKGKYYQNKGEIAGDEIDNDNNGYIDDVNGFNFSNNSGSFRPNFHGVHVCGLLAARSNNSKETSGITRGAKILPFQVNNINTLILAIDYIVTQRQLFNSSNGARGIYIPVISLSLGINNLNCTEVPEFNNAVKRAHEEGILVVSAASNTLGNIDLNVDFPSSCSAENLLVVTASSKDENVYSTSGYSSSLVDVAAPGENLVSVVYTNGNRDDRFFTGTSAATPIVSGIATLLFGLPCKKIDELAIQQPKRIVNEVKNAIIQGASKNKNFFGKCVSQGIVNAIGAKNYLFDNLCQPEELIVKFKSSTPPPTSIQISSKLNLTLQETVVEAWNVYRYSLSSLDTLGLGQFLKNEATIVGANWNSRLKTLSPKWNKTNLDKNKLAELTDLNKFKNEVKSNLSPLASKVTTALFAPSFDLNLFEQPDLLYNNPNEIANNGIDDDNNGWIDDVSGLNLNNNKLGEIGIRTAGFITSNGESDYESVSQASKLLPFSGNTVSDWIKSAYYTAEIRNQFNQSNGKEGALISSFASLTSPPSNFTSTLPTNNIINDITKQLEEIGVIVILPIGSYWVSENTIPKQDSTLVIFAGTASNNTNNAVRLNPTTYQSRQISGVQTVLDGSFAAIGVTAGTIAALYQSACLDLANLALNSPKSTGRLTSNNILTAITDSNLWNTETLTQELSNICGITDGCDILKIYPNPLLTTQTLKIDIATISKDVCPITIFNNRGQIIYRQEIPMNNRLNTISLPAKDIGSGMNYIITTKNGKNSSKKLIRY